MSLEIPRPMPVAEPLTGQFITLTPVDPDRDAAELFQASHQPDSAEALWRYLPAGPFPNSDALAVWLRSLCALPDLLPYTVTDLVTGRRIGSISLMRITPAHGVAELGFIWYAPSAQRTKVNTEANYLLLRHCFEQLQYRRMEWKCDDANVRSRAAALRLGYVFEGIFRQHMVIKGRNRDTAWFAILDQDWPALSIAIRRWLYHDDSISLSLLQAARHGPLPEP